MIDNGNGGFVGRSVRENIYYFTNLIDNQYFLYGLALLTVVFFILSLSLKIREIINIIIFPFILIKKIFLFYKRNKENPDLNKNTSNDPEKTLTHLFQGTHPHTVLYDDTVVKTLQSLTYP